MTMGIEMKMTGILEITPRLELNPRDFLDSIRRTKGLGGDN